MAFKYFLSMKSVVFFFPGTFAANTFNINILGFKEKSFSQWRFQWGPWAAQLQQVKAYSSLPWKSAKEAL